MATPPDITHQLATLRELYARQLPDTLAELHAILEAMQRNPAREPLEIFHRRLHSLSGSGATYGYPRLSETARILEQRVKSSLNQEGTIDAGELAEWSRLLATVAESITDTPQPTFTSLPLTPEPATEKQAIHRVYVLDDDHAISENLAAQLRHFGYKTGAFQTVESLFKAIQLKRPDALVIDVNLKDGQTGPDVAGMLPSDLATKIPIVFISAHDNLSDRLACVRAGGTGYFLKPVNVDLLVDLLDRLTQRETAEPFRVLIVEDNEMLAQLYVTALEKSGMITHIVSQPMKLLEAIQDFNPELILMDMYMPGVRGDELARVIRQDPTYVSIPIVFLSAETNPERQHAAIQTGGDEFLIKPIDLTHLVFSVSARVERYRVLRGFMQRDSLTGLLNHTKSKEFLQSEVFRAQREHNPLSFAMIDIDYFKRVNDTHGHPVGDRVIKGLARLLQQRLRKSDLIGRYGGEEFAVVLPNTARGTARKVLDDLRETFSNITFIAGDARFTCTFSCGLVEALPHENATELIHRADEALYAAKRSGRNRVVDNPG